MKYKLLIILSLCILIISVNLVSAMKIDFYYSPTCSHCQNVIPTINNLIAKYQEPYYVWKTYDVTQMNYNIRAVPTIKIETNDCRSIEISGDVPIINKLPCELNEQSTQKCVTYINGEGTRGGSWFVE